MSRTIEQPIQKAESELKPKNRWKIGLAVASAIALGAITFIKLQPQAPTTPVAIPTPVIESAIALGRLEPQGEVIKVSAPSSAQGMGARVDKILVKEGQLVSVGQVIAILDNRDRTAAALDGAKQQVEVARANLDTWGEFVRRIGYVLHLLT